ncbi:MAG: zinc-binding dehydrogenase [Planctomycetes bacterium]|nr:zinc-binding dehydrogenase [Planctomycetota bacterium]
MKSRQAVLVEPRRFEIRETDIGPADNEVLVRMQGCGMCTSEFPEWLGMHPAYPMAPGHEGWGVVEDKGKGVSERISIGDRVTGLGQHCYSDYFTQSEDYTMVVDQHVEQECLLGEPFYCVHNVVRAAHPVVGDSLALVGMGPMGQWALQGLASRTLQHVIAVDVDETKLAFARDAGATHTVNSAKEDPVDAVLEITGGRMADVVVEGTGIKAGMDTAVRLLRRSNPKLVVMSFFKAPIEVDMTRLCGVAAEIIVAHPGIRKDRVDGCRRTEVLINNAVFRADHLVSHRFRLEDIQGAFETFENRPPDYIKGVVVP